jgi:hypothetical protein
VLDNLEGLFGSITWSWVLWKEIDIADGTFLPPWLAVLWILFQAYRRKIKLEISER